MPERNNITFEIKEHLGIISKHDKGWNKEINLISWNGQAPKYDVREWDEYHERMSRGITMFPDEMKSLVNLYLAYNNRKVIEDRKNQEEEKRHRIESYRKSVSTNLHERQGQPSEETAVDQKLSKQGGEQKIKEPQETEEAKELEKKPNKHEQETA